MGIATFPAAAGGLTSVIRSVQRGVAASAGNITISSVTIAKCLVNSFSTSSSGTVAASGALSAASGTTSAASGTASSQSGSGSVNSVTSGGRYSGVHSGGGTGSVNMSMNAQNVSLNAMNVSLNATNLSGGSTNLVAGVNGAYLSDATTLVATGPCRYEVIEYI